MGSAAFQLLPGPWNYQRTSGDYLGQLLSLPEDFIAESNPIGSFVKLFRAPPAPQREERAVIEALPFVRTNSRPVWEK